MARQTQTSDGQSTVARLPGGVCFGFTLVCIHVLGQSFAA